MFSIHFLEGRGRKGGIADNVICVVIHIDFDLCLCLASSCWHVIGSVFASEVYLISFNLTASPAALLQLHHAHIPRRAVPVMRLGCLPRACPALSAPIEWPVVPYCAEPMYLLSRPSIADSLLLNDYREERSHGLKVVFTLCYRACPCAGASVPCRSTPPPIVPVFCGSGNYIGPCLPIVFYALLTFTDPVLDRKWQMPQELRQNQVTEFVKLQMLQRV